MLDPQVCKNLRQYMETLQPSLDKEELKEAGASYAKKHFPSGGWVPDSDRDGSSVTRQLREILSDEHLNLFLIGLYKYTP